MIKMYVLNSWYALEIDQMVDNNFFQVATKYIHECGVNIWLWIMHKFSEVFNKRDEIILVFSEKS